MKKFVRSMFAIVLAVSMAVSAGALAYAAGGESNVAPYTDGHYTWKIDGKTKLDNAYGSWKNVGSVEVTKSAAPMDISFSVTKKYSHSKSGEIKVSNSVLSSTLGFNVGVEVSVLMTASKKDASAGTYYLRARPVYECWKVKQQRYYVIDGVATKSGSPVYCTVKKFTYAQNKILKG